VQAAIAVAAPVPLPIARGGTNATTAPGALVNLGAAPNASPVFTGDPRAPTPATADNDTSLATTAYVQAQGYATSASVTAADNLRVLKAGDTISGSLNILTDLDVQGRAALMTIDLGDTLATRKGYLDGTNGNASFDGNLTVSGGTFTGAGGNNMQMSGGNAIFNVNVVAADNTKQCGFPGAAWSGVTSYAYTTSSSAALKTDIEPMPPGALAQVLALAPQTYRWRDGPDTERRHHGFIAEQVRDALGTDFGGYVEEGDHRGLAYNELTAVLWRAVQELAAQVAALKSARDSV
jgi:hypothetical protein